MFVSRYGCVEGITWSADVDTEDIVNYLKEQDVPENELQHEIYEALHDCITLDLYNVFSYSTGIYREIIQDELEDVADEIYSKMIEEP